MAKYPNFYENISEANARLCHTIVMYDGEPVYIWAITDHMNDGKFRVYHIPLDAVGHKPSGDPCGSLSKGHSALGLAMDNWKAANPQWPLERKSLESSRYNKFRPFPLGMMNPGAPFTRAQYLQRQPVRPRTEQGLTQAMVKGAVVMLEASGGLNPGPPNMFTPAFRDCIVGNYPSPKTVLTELTSGKYQNESVAFHREFALLLGPIDTLFLSYKGETVAQLPHGDFEVLRLPDKFKHLKEVISELNLFWKVEVK